MIYITGDTHGISGIKKLDINNFPEQKTLTKRDCLIVCGDFGLLWSWEKSGISISSNPKDEHWQPNEIWLKDWYDDKKFTTLWIDGNHENFDRIASYPVEEWNEGKVQKITDSIIHLMRGQVYEIEGYRILTMGGANSIDRGPATGTQLIDEGVCWWPEEKITMDDLAEAQNNLIRVNNKVDFIISHELPTSARLKMGISDNDDCAPILEQLAIYTEYKMWYAGHYHIDSQFDNYRVLYNDIVRL